MLLMIAFFRSCKVDGRENEKGNPNTCNCRKEIANSMVRCVQLSIKILHDLENTYMMLGTVTRI